MTALESEQKDNEALRKARESLEYYVNAENEARRALASAVETTKTVRRKYDELFRQVERRACERRKSGQIENKAGY